MQGSLTICPTPLGNLGDMTLRAMDALRQADVVCAEDTRVTGKLLVALGIEGKRLERLDENVVAERAPQIVARVQQGERIAYCTDAGMPGVSDPGLRLVRAAREAGVAVEVLPGPTAVATAYVASGCMNDTFYFGGFFPRKNAARTSLLESLSPLDTALVFYESPNRLLDTLNCIADTMPLRTICVCRELTKLHEEVVSGRARELFELFGRRKAVKGEIVIVIEGPDREELGRKEADAVEQAQRRAAELSEEGTRPKVIARMLVGELGISRNAAYDIALKARS